MAVELDLEISENPQIDAEVEALQTTGTTDHAALTNRNSADQHPIRAITGLEEKMNEVDQSISGLNETVSSHAQTLSNHSDTLEEYRQTLQTQTEMLENYGQAITSLNEITKNIATTQEIEEVLNNGE